MTPVPKATTAGTILTYFQALEASPSKKYLKRGKRPVPMTIWVIPPPRLPHPPHKAFAVPTTSLQNIREDQNWHITKVPPAEPMNKRRIARPVALLTVPVRAVGMEAKHKTAAIGIRAPHLSQAGPRMKRIRMVPPTPTMEEVQISCLVKPKSSLISERRGAIANQIKKATKNPHQEQWKALM